MNVKTLLAIGLALTMSVSNKCYASETSEEGSVDQCATECADGLRKVGFGDGDKARCTCVEPAISMVDTVVDQNVQAPGPNDGEPLEDNNTDQGVGPAPTDVEEVPEV